MPHLTLPVLSDGPILELLVGVSRPRLEALKRANQPVPKPVKVRGLIDTGASVTCVDPQCLSSLELAPTGQTLIHTPSTDGTPKPCNQYDVSITLVHPSVAITLGEMPIIESALALQGIQALLGRDILSSCLFVYDGREEQFILAF